MYKEKEPKELKLFRERKLKFEAIRLHIKSYGR